MTDLDGVDQIAKRAQEMFGAGSSAPELSVVEEAEAELDHVTDKEAQAVCDFAVQVAQALSLPRYKFTVLEEPCDEEALATISTVEHRWVAQIALNPEWMTKDDDERMNCIVHEVCHLLHRDVDYVVDSSLRYMHTYEFAVVREHYQRETELMVDHLATFLCEHNTVKQAWQIAHGEAPAED